MVKDKKRELEEKDFVEEQEFKSRRRRLRKTIGEEGSRKQTMIGLVASLILGLMFYLPTEFKSWWQEFSHPETITILKPVGDAEDVSEIVGFEVKIEEEGDVKGVIKKILSGLSGDYGVDVENLEDGSSWGINQGVKFSAASVNKLIVLIAYYQAVDEGRLNPEETYVLKEKDRLEYGSGSMQNQAEGKEYTYRQVAGLVANQSDNMGERIMIGWLGGEEKLDRLVKSWGLKQTSVKENETTPEEIGELFKRIYQGELISKESQEELFDNLTETALEDRIPAGVPTGVRVVHKFGSEVGTVNDCGIVYGDEAYGICLLTTGVNDGEAQEVLPKISRVVWEWVEKQKNY